MSFRIVLFVTAVLAVLGAAGGVVLDLTVPGWDDAAPFTAAVGQAVLTAPVAALLTAAVFDRLVSARRRARQDALKDRLVSFIRNDFVAIFDIVAAELFEPGSRFPSLEHLEVVLRTSLFEAGAEPPEVAVRARDTGAVAHLRCEIPVEGLGVAALRYDEVVRRLDRLAEIDPDYLVLAEESRLLALNNHLQRQRYTASGGAGKTPQLVITSWWSVVHSASVVFNAIGRPEDLATWQWPSADGTHDIPRPEREAPVVVSQWAAVQRT